MEQSKALFRPSYVRKPGDFLARKLEETDISKADLARRCGRPLKTISEILRGHLAITPDTALQFEKVLGVAANRWMQLETTYRLEKAKREEVQEIGEHIDWAKQFPLTNLRKRGFISKSLKESDVYQSLMNFLGAANPEAWEDYAKEYYAPALYRRSTAFKNDKHKTLAWLRIGDIKARDIHCAEFDSKAFRATLQNAKQFIGSYLDEFEEPLTQQMASCGVALVIVKDIPGGHMSGAARWASKDKAILQLSNRMNRDDIFWFSFYHEAAHLLLHGKKEVFVDEDKYAESTEEKEANEFAARMLLPKRFWSEFLDGELSPNERMFSHSRIRKFAAEFDVSPGIIVGQLIHIGKLPRGKGFEQLCQKVDRL